MSKRLAPFALAALAGLAFAFAACDNGSDGDGETPAGGGTPAEGETPPSAGADLGLTSDAFEAEGEIPEQYTCDGDGVSPPLSWDEPPEGTASFALVVDDPDAPGRVFTHWVLFDLPAETRSLPEDVPQADRPDGGGVQGDNDADGIGYTGPCPPAGAPHRYQFTLYAVDSLLGLEPGAAKDAVLDAIEGHILGESRLTGTYGR